MSIVSREEAIAKLWQLGDLSYILRGVQKDMRKRVLESKRSKEIFLVSRRSGKTTTMCVLAIEQCIKTPNSIVKFIYPTQNMFKSAVKPTMRMLLEQCPTSLKPEFKTADKVYKFPNGSQIMFAGSDNGNADSLRGGECNLALIDEAGYVDDLNYVVNSIISPTIRISKGRIILASTPSREPNHEFMTDFVQPAMQDDSIIKYTIYDNPMFDEKTIRDIIEDFPQGAEDPAFKREYLCESSSDSIVAVIPEFDENCKAEVVREYELPTHYDFYVSGDPASTDLTVILFAYFDFIRNKLVIYDELVMGGENTAITTDDIATGIFQKERLLFSNKYTGEPQKATLRVMDNNNKILINDLNFMHGLDFIPTAKDNKTEQVNKLRMMLKKREIEIHPRCVNTLHHIKTCKWNNKKDGFVRVKASPDRNLKGHHCDAVDALCYLIRNVDLTKNPYPETSRNSSNMHHLNYNQPSKFKDLMNQILNIKKK